MKTIENYTFKCSSFNDVFQLYKLNGSFKYMQPIYLQDLFPFVYDCLITHCMSRCHFSWYGYEKIISWFDKYKNIKVRVIYYDSDNNF